MNSPLPPDTPDAGDPLQSARAQLEAIVRQHPDEPAPRIELSDVLYRLGHVQASLQALQHVARHLPRNAPLIIQLVQRLIVRGDTPSARACLDFLAQAPDPPVELLLIQARMRWLLGEIAPAVALSGRAAALGLPSPDDNVFHAMLLKFSGHIDEAATVLEKCMQRWPRAGQPVAAWTQLRRQTEAANRLESLKDLKHEPPLAEDAFEATIERAEVRHALFKTLDDLGRHDQAWPALAECNALMHGVLPYNAAAETNIIDAFLRTAGALREPAADDVPAQDGPLPIFIVGMPRSGTSLLEQMLSSHSEVASAGEILDFWRQLHVTADVPQEGFDSTMRLLERAPRMDYAELGRRYLQQTQWRADGHRYYIDKTPINVRLVPFIRRALPHSPILHLVRDPMDVCFSNFKAMFGNASAYSYDVDALVHHYAEYVRITRHWHRTLPGAMLDVRYEDLARDPQDGMRRILAHCDLAMQDACLRPERNAAPVATPSSVQVREPIHTRSIGQWKDYAEPLEPLRQALAGRMLLG